MVILLGLLTSKSLLLRIKCAATYFYIFFRGQLHIARGAMDIPHGSIYGN